MHALIGIEHDKLEREMIYFDGSSDSFTHVLVHNPLMDLSGKSA